MDVKLAAWLTITGGILITVGVGLFDYRAGLIILGLLATVVGVWRLTQE
jgi:hypothetical protein